MAVNAQGGEPLVTVLTIVIELLPQLSVAVGVSNVQAAPLATTLSEAQVILGERVSCTVIDWMQLALLLHPSVTV